MSRSLQTGPTDAAGSVLRPDLPRSEGSMPRGKLPVQKQRASLDARILAAFDQRGGLPSTAPDLCEILWPERDFRALWRDRDWPELATALAYVSWRCQVLA